MFFRYGISDQAAAALVNGFLTDIQRDNNPAQRIDPQEIAREKVKISKILEQASNADIHSGNQSIDQLDIKVEENVVEDSITLIKLEQKGNADIHSDIQSTSHLDIKVEETVVKDSGTLTSPDSSFIVKSGTSNCFSKFVLYLVVN